MPAGDLADGLHRRDGGPGVGPAAPGPARPGRSGATRSDPWLSGLRLLGLDALTAATSDLLAMAGIPSLLLKGPATTRWLYPDEPDRRPYGDVDLLVPVNRFVDAQSALRAGGYRAVADGTSAIDWAWHEIPWQAPPPVDLLVDLHRGFAGVDDPEGFFDALWASKTELSLCGSTVAIPSAGGTALIVTLHAASPGLVHRPLAELVRAREVLGPQVWRDAGRLAELSGAESAFRTGLGLLPNGSEIADELGVEGVVAAEQWLGGRHRDRVSVSLAAALALPTRRAKVRYVLRRVLPTPAFLRLSDAGARSGPGGLAIAYGRRALRALTGAPRAVADLREARRAAGPGRAGGSGPETGPGRAGGSGLETGRDLVTARALVPGAVGRRVQQLRRMCRLARFVLRSLRHGDLDTARTGTWAWASLGRARRLLPLDGLAVVDLSAPPCVRAVDRVAVHLVLRVRGASCLEKAVVLQRFDAAAGRPRTLIVGVTGPRNGFRAHAWLDGDPQRDADLQEIVRREVPAPWLAGAVARADAPVGA